MENLLNSINIFRFKVKDEKIQHVDVIPKCIFEKEGDNALRIENMAKIPLYYLLTDLKTEGGGFYLHELVKRRKKKFWICNYPYSYELGFEYNIKVDDVYII